MAIESFDWREPKGDEYIISQETSGTQTTTHYSSEPIRGVKDEMRHAERTEAIAEKLMIRLVTGGIFPNNYDDEEIPEDKKMSGGYPYDAIRHIDKDEAILPGLAGQGTFDEVAPRGRRTAWNNVFTIQGTDETEVTIGMLDKKWYILDPMTKMAITPAFDYTVSVDNDRIVVAYPNHHGHKYEFSARPTVKDMTAESDVQWKGKRKYPKTPDFLCSRTLSMKRVPDYEPAVINESAQTGRLVESNVFGLEPESNYEAVRGREMFAGAFMHMAEYAQINKVFRQEFSQPERTLSLPYVSTATIDARLSVKTYQTGESTIEIWPKSHQKFTIIQQSTGEVVLINSRGQTLTSDDAEYIQYVTMTDELLNEYFTRLYEEQTGFNAEKLRDLRQKLGKGGIAGWQAARQIRKNFGSRV